MNEAVQHQPIYDQRVNEIIRGLMEGKSRDKVAKELGYKNYKSLDIYMNRKNFKWDPARQEYVPKHNQAAKMDLDLSLPGSSRIRTILSLFAQEGADARVIAKQMGFADHRELANYMKAKGYHWSSKHGNYVKTRGIIHADVQTVEADIKVQEKTYSEETMSPLVSHNGDSNGEPASLERYLPLLSLLERNKDKLIKLMMPGSESGKVPRYAVPGVLVTKSVHMSNTLDQLVREYSKEKNISQRDIFTVALIEFFRKYGYEQEIETLLGER